MTDTHASSICNALDVSIVPIAGHVRHWQHSRLQIDKRDKGTPDDWVPRHPELIRLTGRWVLTDGAGCSCKYAASPPSSLS